MTERLQKLTRPIVLATLPLWATMSACNNSGDKKPLNTEQPPTSISTQKPNPTETMVHQADLLAPEKQKFLKMARQESKGAIFVEITQFDPNNNIYLLTQEVTGAPGEVTARNIVQIYDRTNQNRSGLIEASVLVDDCNGHYQLAIAIDEANNFYALGFANEKGEARPTFQLNQQECFKFIQVPIKNIPGLPTPHP